YLPVPFLSLLIDDCVAKGKDYNDGGARYNTTYIQGVGIGSLTDSLSAIKYHVFDKARFTLPLLNTMLKADFEEEEYESARKLLLEETPRYGNDDDYADDIMTQAFGMFFDAVDGRPAGREGKHRINMLPTTCHVYFGSVVGALPEGRKAFMPLSEGISPVQGADVKGPTSVVKSAAKMDHIKTGGTLLNQKFTPAIMNDEAGRTAVLHLVRSYFAMDGHHIQFNVVDADTLRKAQQNPEQYRSLIVRVAGYSDYFVDLTLQLQEEIILRTEHKQA
ncbi:MAG: formate C-acetyltransferase/glycerol dehydratase family glycyl radical enzyme, partial [bacterium]|nr:formate C-acetyltransferase/glycerol dehydratase family glycyl radical enzyme [bacterium]